MKVNIIPRIVNKLRRCIAIVEDGDTCSISGGIASGKWIIWKGGLYQTSEPISYGNSFAVGTNLIAKDDGIGNQLQTQISELNSKLKLKSISLISSIETSSNVAYYNAYGVYPGTKAISSFTNYDATIWSKRIAVIPRSAYDSADATVPYPVYFASDGVTVTTSTPKPGRTVGIYITVLYYE